MTKTIPSTRLAELIKLLGSLESLHQELLTLIRAKIEAIRKADVDTLNLLNERDQAITERIREQEGLRQQLMDEIGTAAGMGIAVARTWPLSQLASRVAEPYRSALLSTSVRLRELVVRTAKVNRVVGTAARSLFDHLRWVFAAVRPQADAPVGYSGSGLVTARSDRRIVDAVG